MKTKLILIIFPVILLVLASCKKDYPNDIPQWLENKIKECKKGSCCTQLGPLGISEYVNTNDQSYIYKFWRGCPHCCDEYYDFNGNLICTNNIVWCPGDSCGTIPFNTIVFSRDIWRENPDKCK